MVSIIIRSKNEQKWISSCLESIFRQTYKDFEIIIVDNCSTDRTLEKAKEFDVKVITIKDFYPGLALNLGIRASIGDFITSISAHCIPVDEYWLEKLLSNFDDPEVAGVYGRQEPLTFTDDLDKRDLINVFGPEKRVQRKDPFFHNANSMIRRDVWEKYPFDEGITNIEDRIWAKNILEAGYKIIYEPEASVYHYHGINQGRNIERTRSIVRILEQIHPISARPLDNKLNITAIIPVCGSVKTFKGKPLITRTITSALKSQYVNNIIVASDNEEHLNIAQNMNVNGILRPKSLSHSFIPLEKVYQFVLEQISEEGKLPDLLVLIEEIYPFRPPWLIDRMIESLLRTDYDSVVAAHSEYNIVWRSNGDDFIRVDHGTTPSKFKEPVYIGLIGLATVTHPNIVLEGSRVGAKVGLVELDNPFSGIKVRDEVDFIIAEAVESKWQEFLQKSRMA